MPQIREKVRAMWMCRLQVKTDTESLEVPSDVLECRIALLKKEPSGELSLHGRLQIDPNLRDECLRAFRVKVPAIPLEMGTQMQDASAQTLVEKSGPRRRQCRYGRAVRLDLDQPRQAIRLPSEKRGR